MSKLMSLIRRAPKRFSAVTLMAAAAVIVPAVVFAWGPTDRATFTVEKPATYNTFNSITNNPDYGDERNFVRIKDASDTGPGNWKDEITVDANKEYLVQMYVHNNAADNLNQVAENVKVMANVPNTTGKQIQIDGFVTSSNSNPTKIWDQAIFKSSQDFNLTYVPGSAILYNNVFGKTGAQLSDNIVTSNGALVGYDKLDGKIPGCFKYSGYVSFKVKAQVGGVLNFTTNKLVSKHGANDWTDNYKAQPGETVDYLLEYRNVGTVQQDNVMVRDILPANTTYVNGTTVLGNSKYPSGAPVSDNGITGSGINIGSYAPNGNAWIIFSAKVAEKEKLPCGTSKLVNTVHTTVSNYYKEDNATVTVDKDCPKPVAKYTCDSLDVKKLTRTSVRFTTNYTVENAAFKSVTYVIRDASGKVVDTKTSTGNTLDYAQTTPGKYTVEATVTVTVDGQDKTATSAKCKGAFEIEKEKVVKYTCNALEVKSISRTEFRFSTAYSLENATFKNITYIIRDASGAVVDTITATTNSTNYTQTKAGTYTVQANVTFTVNGEDKTVTSDKCKGEFKVKDLPKEITVCKLATKEIVTIKESEFNPSLYSKNLDDCKEPIKVCEIDTKQIVTIDEKDFDSAKYTKDLSKCETPVVPPELPQTGATENIVAIVGLGAMIASIAYYVASRRALNQ